MRHVIKQYLLVAGLAFSLQTAWGFSLLGPDALNTVKTAGDAWQVQAIGFNPLATAYPFGFTDPVATGPKNLGEGYRQNIPVLYYACDAAFLDYFGSNGMVAVEQAYGLLNSVTNVDNYSPALTEIPLNSERLNYQADAWGLYDLKSALLPIMMEQLGLADSIRYTWVLHDRYTPAGTTCVINPGGSGTGGYEYLVVQRNYDITASPLIQVNGALAPELQYSAYINGSLYTYQITEYCGLALTAPLTAAATPVFNRSSINPPVASGAGLAWLPHGFLYTGLTRDDVAGLRYLISTNDLAIETPGPGSLLEQTGTSEQLLGTTNLAALLSAAQTNNAATLQTLFPGVVVSSSSNYYVLGTNITVTSYFTNYIGSPIGSPPVLVLVTNYSLAAVQRYVTTFANVVITTNFFGRGSFSTNSSGFLQTVTIAPPNGAPIGTASQTNVSYQRITLTNVPSGDYYLIPAGSCDFTFISTNPLYNIVTAYTNLITSAFTTNASGQLYGFSESVVTLATNHVFLVYPCTFATPTPGLYQGIERIQFVQADYDSLLSQSFVPITNYYSMVIVSNSQPHTQIFQRVVTTPDYIMDAADLNPGPAGALAEFPYSRTLTFTSHALPGLAGPGNMPPGATFTFNKIANAYVNVAPYDLNGPRYGQFFLWGSFDTSTNAPIVYPTGTDIANLVAEVLIQIFPPNLPNGTNEVAYSVVHLTATGGQAPYGWAVASGTSLPPGLGLSSSGVISGTPTQSGLYQFAVQMTDAANRTVYINYSITIN